MREVAQRRQQLEVEHEQARLSLQEKQEEVRRLQQVGAGLGRGRSGGKVVGCRTPALSSLVQWVFTENPLCARHCAGHWRDWEGAKIRSLTDQQVNRSRSEMIPVMAKSRGGSDRRDVTQSGWDGVSGLFRELGKEGL